MTSYRLSELAMVCSRYWDHAEPGQVVKVDGAVVHVEVGGGMLGFDVDTLKISDPEWGSSVWIETAFVTRRLAVADGSAASGRAGLARGSD